MERLKQFEQQNCKLPEPFCSGECFVVASGHTVWDDLLRAGFHTDLWKQNVGIMAINDAGMHLPCHLDHWYSNDTLFMKACFEARRPDYKKADKANNKTLLHSNNHPGLVDYHWPWPGNGTSTMGGVLTALALGYEEVKICGAPLDGKGHYFDPPWKRTNFDKEGSGGQRFWRSSFRDLFEGRVKFMSGEFSV